MLLKRRISGQKHWKGGDFWPGSGGVSFHTKWTGLCETEKLFCEKSSALEYQKVYDICHNFRKTIAFLFYICLMLLNVFQL